MPKTLPYKPIIVITTGDPAGIGPEITEKALKNPALKGKAEFTVIGNYRSKYKAYGKPTASGGSLAVENIKKAVKILDSLKSRKALVTAPISKFSLKEAGFKFRGHTELLGYLTKTKNIAMMFSKGAFKIAIVTRHIPLSRVSRELTEEKIINTTRLFYLALKNRFKIRNPKIGISALNPHAGESGIMGTEEEELITPAIKKLKRAINYKGTPKPADSLFHDLYKGNLDGIVCMYHDQGLIPFKMLYFEEGVNITLGLPFIRTSPDHGTAFDIAGKGKADPTSMIEAIKLAIRLA